jgi:hypothetical protein
LVGLGGQRREWVCDPPAARAASVSGHRMTGSRHRRRPAVRQPGESVPHLSVTAPADEPGRGAADVDIRCDRCAASCCRLEVFVLSDTGVPAHLTTTDSWGGTVMRRLEDGWCVALDRRTLRCSIYSRRPWVCRALEMGGDECRGIRAEDLGAKRC